MIRLLFRLAAISALMAGCQTPVRDTPARPPQHGGAEIFQSENEQDRALRFYDHIRSMSGREFQAEYDAARRAFGKDPNDLNRIQLAMALSLPVSGFGDESTALELLQPLVKARHGERSSLRPLAMLLHSELSERRRLEEATDQLSSRLKDEQKHADSIQQKSDALQQRIDELQHKLDALLDMEKNMIEREQSAPPTRKQP